MGVRKLRFSAVALAGLQALAGCESISHQFVGHDEAPVIYGSPVRNNITPLDPALACFAGQLRTGGRVYGVGVGDVKDYTGKYAQNEGAEVTQGGALMVYSALGKLGQAIRIHERFDTRIAEAELAYTDRRQLGDGQAHQVGVDPKGQPRAVPWVPYYGGTILQSDYFIIGGITELNYNIQSGGAEVAINEVGPKARIFTMNIGVDLRIVDSRTLVVVKTTSIEKQVTGYEVGFGIFRFFGDQLFDINIGAKSQEPLQLGVRTALELGVMKLVSAISRVDYRQCLPPEMAEPILAADDITPVTPMPVEAKAPAPPSAPAPVASTAPINAVDDGSAPGVKSFQVPFELGQTSLSGQAESTINDIVTTIANKGGANVTIVSRENETFAQSAWTDVIARRVGALSDALAARGVKKGWITTTWTRTAGNEQIARDGPGFQEIARLQIRING